MIRKYLEDAARNHSDYFKAEKVKHHHRVKLRTGRLRDGGRGRSIMGSSYGWFRVTLHHAKIYDTKDLIRKLKRRIWPVELTPLGLQLEGDNVIFYVDNIKASEEISYCNLKIKMEDGCLMQIKVQVDIPVVDRNMPLEEIVAVISSKYDNTAQHLDLSKFHANEEFLKRDLLVPLNALCVAEYVFRMTRQHFPELKSLNLSHNIISTTRYFFMLKAYLNELISIDLSSNKIRDVSDLAYLQQLNLESLVLDYNPICTSNFILNHTEYVRQVRTLFPTLASLDGVVFTASLCNLTTNRDDGDFIQQFLELFYSLYDDLLGDRSALHEAYALNCEFSLTTSNFTGDNLSILMREKFIPIRVIYDLKGRTEILVDGKQNIVNCLNTLPKTQHDRSSFRVDVLVSSPQRVSFRISGVFREVEYTPSPIKEFKREFTVISSGTEFSIVRDTVCVTDSSSDQATTSFESQSTSNELVADVSNLFKTSLRLDPDTVETSTQALPPSTPVISQEKQAMIVALSKHTGMNLSWSQKCLDETNWELKKSIEAFTDFHKKNAIPPEAFV